MGARGSAEIGRLSDDDALNDELNRDIGRDIVAVWVCRCKLIDHTYAFHSDLSIRRFWYIR